MFTVNVRGEVVIGVAEPPEETVTECEWSGAVVDAVDGTSME